VFLHYQPYWNAQPGQFARTQQYKLYRDGGFFDVPKDLEESNDLDSGNLGVGAAKAKKMLTGVLNQAPPAPTEPGSRTTVTDQPMQIGPILQTNI
jgi:arylsulfatase A